VVVGLFGLGLLALAVELKVWTGGLHTLWLFGALIGLFTGYGLGGDLWGARIFDFFVHTESRKLVGEPLSPAFEKTARLLGVVIAGALVLAAAFIAAVVWRRE